ncbi:hypothetical protein B0H14DRAFT_2729985 [Mycena olivaceomarginata]|nr:hypothetical protein B0H14DRAFT_2729985 [Mycena olivaceomarginata]
MPFFKLKRRNVQSSVAQPGPAPTAPDSVTKPVISPSTRKAALNAFKTTLEVLGKAPLPGIGMVAAAALRVIQGLQDTGSVKEGWDGLAERMERLSVFLIEMKKSKSYEEESIQRHCDSLKTELEKLANAIEEALRTKNFVAFWNTSADSASVEAYGKKLDTFVGDLTLVFCGTIGLSRDVLGEKISAYLEDIHANSESATRSMIMEFSENTIDIMGSAAKINAQNKNRRGDMQMTANKNRIGFMNGQINTGNTNE